MKELAKIPYQFLASSYFSCIRTLRIWRLRFKGKKIGKNVLGVGPRFMLHGDIEIGDNFSAYWDCRIVSNNAKVFLGNNVVFSHHVDISAGPGGHIKIGDDCSLAQFVVVRNCSHRFDDPDLPIRQQGHNVGNIEIEEDCLISASCIILPNTKLGRGCVVGSGSVVSGTFPPYSIIVGNPARLVRKRK